MWAVVGGDQAHVPWDLRIRVTLGDGFPMSRQERTRFVAFSVLPTEEVGSVLLRMADRMLDNQPDSLAT